MIGIGRLIVFADMATCTGIRRVVIVSVVAGGAIIGDGSMRAVQLIIIIVNGKGSRGPAGVGGMAGGTICWYGEGQVIRIGALVVIRRMAAGAGIGCVGVIAIVAGIAVSCNGGVRSGQRIKTVVV